jgi:ABC-type Fe3+-citrate transport system substrate-binding protein
MCEETKKTNHNQKKIVVVVVIIIIIIIVTTSSSSNSNSNSNSSSKTRKLNPKKRGMRKLENTERQIRVYAYGINHQETFLLSARLDPHPHS